MHVEIEEQVPYLGRSLDLAPFASARVFCPAPPKNRLRICSRPREKKLHGSNLLNVDAQMLSSLCHKAQVPDCLAPISGCPISQRVLSLPVPPSALTLKTSYRARLTLMILFRRCDVPTPYLHVVWEMKRTWGKVV